MIRGIPKADSGKPHTKALIGVQLRETHSAKVIVTLWVRWKKPVKLATRLDPEDVDEAQYISDNTGDYYIKVEMPFNCLITDFLKVAILTS